jgi:uncharacterized protein involved in outer membrane biogenesis
MKALKIFGSITVVLLAVYFGTAWYLSENLDRIVREAVEEAGTKQLDSRVSIESVSVSIPAARARLSGLSFGNPEGYSDRPVIYLGSIDVDLDISSLNEDVLIIEEITIENPQVNYEINSKGVSNLDVIEEKISKATGGSKGGGDKKLIIDRIDFKGGTITATAAQNPGKELVFDFPVVFMTDLGRPDGATGNEIADQVTAVLLERSMDAAKRAGVQSLVDEQKERLQDKAREKLDEKLKDLLKKGDG